MVLVGCGSPSLTQAVRRRSIPTPRSSHLSRKTVPTKPGCQKDMEEILNLPCSKFNSDYDVTALVQPYICSAAYRNIHTRPILFSPGVGCLRYVFLLPHSLDFLPEPLFCPRLSNLLITTLPFHSTSSFSCSPPSTISFSACFYFSKLREIERNARCTRSLTTTEA